jgi:hypothetical protein
MPKRGSDADHRIFFDELVSLAAFRLRATGAIRLEDRQRVIAFGDEDYGLKRRKCVGVAHTKFPNGGLVEPSHLSEVRWQEKEALARRRRATLSELLLVLRRALSLGLRLRPSGASERAPSLRTESSTDDCAGANVGSQ